MYDINHHTCLQSIITVCEKYKINISPPTLIIYQKQYFLKELSKHYPDVTALPHKYVYLLYRNLVTKVL